ncbi:hypothetical protein BD408DRAFT_403959 [Parasitella parasitica]|nr:hypothetical protein BD408DRAFT_403959 [Parasitella parasitica]
MFRFSSLIASLLFAVAASVVANEDVSVLGDEEVSETSEVYGNNVIPVVQTIDGIATTVYYTIIEEQTIIEGDESSIIDQIDDDELASYPNIAKAMKNMDAFEDMLARILKENPEFGMKINSEDSQASASVSMV